MSAVSGLLLRAHLRRDRLLIGIWLALLVLVVYASAAATGSLYPTLADRVAAARAIDTSPATVALYGPVLDERSLGELAMTKVTVLYAVVLAALLLVVVRRHARGEEESGRAELVAGTLAGPRTQLGVVLAEGVLVSLAAGVLAALASVAGGLPVAGSVLLGGSWAGTGLVATGLAALACQVSASGRTCLGVAGVAIALLHLARAVADVGPGWLGWLGWLTPFGWGTRLRAWSDPRPWVLLLYAALALALAVLAALLRARRDLGAGLVAARPGPATGSPRLGSALGLAWRTQRAALLGWTVAVAALGAVLGAIAPGIGDLLDTEAGRELVTRLGGEGRLQDALLAAVLSIVAVVVTGFGLAVLARAGADEREGRTEQVLATATSRGQAGLAVLVVALLGPLWLLAVTGLATGLGLGRDVGGLLAAGLAQVPAVWVVVGLGALLLAVRSAWAAAGWGVLAAAFLLEELGDLLSLPGWVAGLSPYAHVPAMSVQPFAAGPALVLTAVASVCVLTAWWRGRSRDIG